MKKFIILFIMLFAFSNVLAEDDEMIRITTVKEIIKRMVEKYENIKTYRANFYINSVIDNVESWGKGELKYRIPDTFIMNFTHPKDQMIFSDGKDLKIYIPQLNVLGEQSLEHYRPGFLISGKSSLYYLKNKFDFSFYKSNKPVLIGDMPYYVLELTQKEVTAGFKTIMLYVSKYWLITKAEATTINGDKIKISFSNITVNRRITDHEFEYNLPVNTQTVKNPLLFTTKGE
ncbi:MAG: outer-membrane lipoprotein carrier protein LolA [Spirochaetes bacterium]|nr:outer-membrane lipoprotein carrier protein LolA [Spirochaetota bacterium]